MTIDRKLRFCLGLDKLRSERKEILKTSERKKPARQRRRRHLLELAQLDSPDQSFHASPSSLPRSLTDEDEMLNNIRLLLTYLREKMVEHHLVFDDLTSPLFHPNLNECQSAPVPIAMRLPRNFAPLTFQSNTTNEILRSPHYPDVSIEYKKELPTDILDKYAGSSNKNEKQTSLQLNFGKKNRKNKKVGRSPVEFDRGREELFRRRHSESNIRHR